MRGSGVADGFLFGKHIEMALTLLENIRKRMIAERSVFLMNIITNMIGTVSMKNLFSSTAVLAEYRRKKNLTTIRTPCSMIHAPRNIGQFLTVLDQTVRMIWVCIPKIISKMGWDTNLLCISLVKQYKINIRGL